MWETKVVAAAETNWKHKVTPDWGDLMMVSLVTHIRLTRLNELIKWHTTMYKYHVHDFSDSLYIKYCD